MKLERYFNSIVYVRTSTYPKKFFLSKCFYGPWSLWPWPIYVWKSVKKSVIGHFCHFLR